MPRDLIEADAAQPGFAPGQPAGGATPAYGWRRAVFAVLVIATIASLFAMFTLAIGGGGIDVVELALVSVFALTLPWLVVGFWNAVIGAFLLWRDDGGSTALVPLAAAAAGMPVRSRTALVLPIHEEDVDLAFAHLRTTVASLDACRPDGTFDVFILSDTQSENVAERERRLFREWQACHAGAARLHYRRRGMNTGFKAGNIRDFCDRWGGAYDFMIVLDADSVMTGRTILRLVRLMQASPQFGILQTLCVGLPAASAFARLFQFGMRHGMRSYTVGSAWWQGDAGPYWGHNAIIRLAPFIAHCRLPSVPGGPPLGGAILSHDQVEAVLMRKAGFEVRVLPVEEGSYEVNPPTLPDFIKRDLRWCQGNMQYLRLLRLPGIKPLGRLQLLLAILMYTGAPCWLAFLAIGTLHLFLADLPVVVAPQALPSVAGSGPAFGVIIFLSVLTMSQAPKLLGVVYALAKQSQRQAFGGAARLLSGAFAELLFSLGLGPVMSVAQSLCMLRLAAGRPVRWRAQVRSDRRVSWREASLLLWPQTLIGVAWFAALLATQPALLVWAAPVLSALLLAIPFAVITARRRAGAALARQRLCATPEELAPAREVLAACPWLAPPPALANNAVRFSVS
jgi:membrane glycosyltransferase